VGPLVGFLWLRRLTPESNPAARAYRGMRRDLQLTLPALRAEALLFVGASLLGGGRFRLGSGTPLSPHVAWGSRVIAQAAG
jgi:hypothetical protein